jgi:hypothetical protein
MSGFFIAYRCSKKLKMEFKTHHIAETKIAKIISDDSIITQNKDGINLLGNVYYQGFDEIIIFEKILHLTFLFLKPELQERYSKSLLSMAFG